MEKFMVSITFSGVVEATNSEEAWNKVYEALSDSCGEYETAMEEIGMTEVEHSHEEPEKQ